MYDYGLILSGIIGGIVFALSGAFKALKEGEKPDLIKFLTTAILGGIVGGIMGFTGIPFTESNFTTQVVLFGFLTVIIENVLKGLVRGEQPAEGVGVFLRPGKDGWTIQINTSIWVKALPANKRYQAVSPGGKVWNGDKEIIEFLADSDDAAAKAWRERHK